MTHPVLVSLIVVCSLFAAAAPARAQGPEAEAGKRALSLRECVDIGLRTNPTILAAQGQSEAAAGRTKQARGPLYPQIAGGASISRFESDAAQTLVGGSPVPSPKNRYDEANVQVSLDQSVISLSRWRTASGAKSSQRAAESAYRMTQEDLILEVERAYYGYLKTIHLEEVALENRRVGEEQLKLAEKRHEVGIGVEADILKAKAQNASDRLAVIITQKNTKVALTTLCHVMGIELDTPLTVEDIDQNETIEPPAPPDVEAALAERADVVEQRHQVRASEEAHGAAKAERYPNVDFNFGYKRVLDAENTGFDLVDSTGAPIGDLVTEFDDYGSWSATLGLSMPIFRGGSIRGRINESRANLTTEREFLEQIERDARLEIETASLNATAAAEAIGVSREGVAAAEEDLRVSQGSYTHGLVPILNLVEAQAALARAKVALVVSTYDHRIALGELDRALGRGVSKFAP